jgi:hypothetical protein
VARGEVPGEIEDEEDEDRRDGMPAAQMTEIVREGEVEDGDCEREDEAGESLRENAEGAAGSKAEGGFEEALLLREGAPEEIEGERGPETEEDVADQEVAEEEDAVRSEQREDGVERGGGRVEDAAAERERGDREAEDGDGDGQTRGPVGDIEEAEAHGDGPVKQRRVVGIDDAVGEGGEPVAAGEHLAGDFGAQRVGTVEERRLEEREGTVEEHPDSEQGEDEALRRAEGGHGVQGTGCGGQGTEPVANSK